MYDIDYLSGTCVIVRVGHALLVCSINYPNTLLGYFSHLQVLHPPEPLLSTYLVLSFDIQEMIFRMNYGRECHLHGYQ